MVHDPIFEHVEIDGRVHVVNCWYQALNGAVYFNRNRTPYRELPFVHFNLNMLAQTVETTQDNRTFRTYVEAGKCSLLRRIDCGNGS